MWLFGPLLEQICSPFDSSCERIERSQSEHILRGLQMRLLHERYGSGISPCSGSCRTVLMKFTTRR